VYVDILIKIEYRRFEFFLVAIFIYCEDPRGNIPKAVWSWAAKVCRIMSNQIFELFFVLVWCSIICKINP
jgi:hypothetical protein